MFLILIMFRLMIIFTIDCGFFINKLKLLNVQLGNDCKFKLMVERIRASEEMIGMYNFSLYNNMIDTKKIKKMTRRFKTKKNVKKNNFLKEKDLELIRTNSTKNYIKFDRIMKKIISTKIKKNLKSGKFLSLKDFK